MHIESCPSYPALLEGLCQCLLVHQATAGCVNEECPLPHLLYSKVIDEVVVMFVEIAVQGDTVALIQQVLQGVDPLHAQGPLYPILLVGVIKYDAESKGLGSNSNRLPCATEADEAQCLPTDSSCS